MSRISMATRDELVAAVSERYGEAMPRIEIVAERRRAHTEVFRADVLAEVATPGVRVQDVACESAPLRNPD